MYQASELAICDSYSKERAVLLDKICKVGRFVISLSFYVNFGSSGGATVFMSGQDYIH